MVATLNVKTFVLLLVTDAEPTTLEFGVVTVVGTVVEVLEIIVVCAVLVGAFFITVVTLVALDCVVGALVFATV